MLVYMRSDASCKGKQDNRIATLQMANPKVCVMRIAIDTLSVEYSKLFGIYLGQRTNPRQTITQPIKPAKYSDKQLKSTPSTAGTLVQLVNSSTKRHTTTAKFNNVPHGCKGMYRELTHDHAHIVGYAKPCCIPAIPLA